MSGERHLLGVVLIVLLGFSSGNFSNKTQHLFVNGSNSAARRSRRSSTECHVKTDWNLAEIVGKCSGMESITASANVNLDLSQATDVDLTKLLSTVKSIEIPLILVGSSIKQLNLDNVKESHGMTFSDNQNLQYINFGKMEKLMESGIAFINNTKLKTIDFSKVSKLTIRHGGIEIKNNPTLSEFYLGTSSLALRDGLVVSGNKDLNKLSIQMTGNIDAVVNVTIKNNRNLGKVELDKLMKLKENTATNWDIQEPGECIFPDPVQDLAELEDCVYVDGDLVLAPAIKAGGQPVKPLRSVKGNVVIKDTNNKDLLKLFDKTKVTGNLVCELHGELLDFWQLKNPLCKQKFIGDLKVGPKVKGEPENALIKDLEGCYNINNTNLTTVSFIYGTKTRLDCTNEIINNPLLCDTREVGRQLVAWTKVTMENNCERVCYTDDEIKTKNCKEAYGEVPFEELNGISRIRGALVIQKLKNASIDLSVYSHIQYDRLVIRNNEFLCDETTVEAAAGVEVRFENNCWHECFSTSELRWKDCVVFNGDVYLRMGVEELGLVTKLEEIRGRLVIEGSDIEEIQWKSLRKVVTKEPGPAILIQHNRRLKKVNLRGLREVESRKQPWIKITDNGEFKFTTKQWRRIMKKTGARIRFQLVVDAHPMENGNKIYYPNVVFKTPKLDEAKVNRFKYTCYATMVLEALICLYCTWWIKRWCDRETMREEFGDLHG